MPRFRIDDMTCQHCVGAITRAVKAADAAAQVQVDLANHEVVVEGGALSGEALKAVIEDAGYTPESVG